MADLDEMLASPAPPMSPKQTLAPPEQNEEVASMKKTLQKSIDDFQRTISDNKFKSPQERQDMQNLVETLKTKLDNLETNPPVKNTPRKSTI